jgi:hypothetical protein
MEKGTQDILLRMDGLRDRLDRLINIHTQPGDLLMSQFDTLRDEVRQTRTVVNSAAALIAGLSERLRGVQSPEDLSDVISDLDSMQNELATAVAANTPGNAPSNENPSVSNPTGAPQPDESFPASNVPPANRPEPGQPALEPSGLPSSDVTNTSPTEPALPVAVDNVTPTSPGEPAVTINPDTREPTTIDTVATPTPPDTVSEQLTEDPSRLDRPSRPDDRFEQ